MYEGIKGFMYNYLKNGIEVNMDLENRKIIQVDINIII